jgi:hypothetical protein
MVTSVHDLQIESQFPAAATDGYILTSAEDPNYNCIAWANGDDDIWWWPTPHEITGVYWPESAPIEATVGAFVIAYSTCGWVECGTNGSLEAGFEKLALYVDKQQTVLHAARQLHDGNWTSKLGPYKDIGHTSPAALESSPAGDSKYGVVAMYMKRAVAE